MEQITLSQADADSAPTAAAGNSGIGLKLVESVEVELQALLGTARTTVGELAAMAPGAVVTLDAQLNSVVELRLNGQAVARGELVAVDDRFGVRLTEIVQWPG